MFLREVGEAGEEFVTNSLFMKSTKVELKAGRADPPPQPSSPPLPKPFPSSSPEPPHHAGKGGGDV